MLTVLEMDRQAGGQAEVNSKPEVQNTHSQVALILRL